MSGQQPDEPVVKEKRHKSPKVGNGAVKHAADDYPREEEPSVKQKHKSKHESAKKSVTSSSVVEVKPTQPIQESPSMSALTSKLDDISLTSPSNPDTSLLSEISSGGTTTTTITITSMTDDATIITKDFEDEEDFPPAPDVISELKEEKSDGSSSEGKIANGACKNLRNHDVIVEEQDVYQIVESIRKSTNLSHELSQLALRVVISEMEALLPDSGKFLEPIAVHLSSPLSVPDNLLGDSHDAQRLRNLFSELADAKNDEGKIRSFKEFIC